jgi:ribonuclease/clavin/mitogillin
MSRARIDVPSSTRARTGRTSAYVLGDSDALLIDPPSRSDDLDDVVQDRGVEHVAVTHHHPDHVTAVRSYADEFDLTVWARAGRTEAFRTATGVEPDRTFRDGTVIPAGDGIEVVETPGHAPEHVGYRTDAGIVSGDLAVADGSVVIGAPAGDMRAYLTSLRRIHARDPPALFPGHGPTIEDPRGTCSRLIGHRLERERRIHRAVEGGARTPDDIVDAAYEKDISDVYRLARATVLAHLEKLAIEGGVLWDGERARPA